MFFGDFNKTILVIDAKVQEDLHRPEDKKSASRYWWRCVIARFFLIFIGKDRIDDLSLINSRHVFW
jgi:hypothetical protein